MNKYTNSYNNSNGKNKRFRNKRYYNYRGGKYNSNLRVPVISNKPITMGYGSLYLNITSELTTGETPVTQYTLSNLITNSNEYLINRSKYMYMKVNYVKFIFLPENILVDTSYLLVNWANNHDYTLNQIKNSDNVKIIPAFRTRYKIFTFIPPNITINGHNLNEFITTSVASGLPGYFYVTSDLPINFRIEINILFRGSQDFNIPSMITQLKEAEENKIKQEKEQEKVVNSSKIRLQIKILEERLKMLEMKEEQEDKE